MRTISLRSAQLVRKGKQIKVAHFTNKSKECEIEKLGELMLRTHDRQTAAFDLIAKSLFGTGTNMAQFVGIKLRVEGEVGEVEVSERSERVFYVRFSSNESREMATDKTNGYSSKKF